MFVHTWWSPLLQGASYYEDGIVFLILVWLNTSPLANSRFVNVEDTPDPAPTSVLLAPTSSDDPTFLIWGVIWGYSTSFLTSIFLKGSRIQMDYLFHCHWIRFWIYLLPIRITIRMFFFPCVWLRGEQHSIPTSQYWIRPHFGAFCVYKVYNKGYNHLQSLSGILAANHLAGLITT